MDDHLKSGNYSMLTEEKMENLHKATVSSPSTEARLSAVAHLSTEKRI
jgi:hypothetical protein